MPAKLEVPCKGCKRRSTRCHIKCESYNEYAKERAKYRKDSLDQTEKDYQTMRFLYSYTNNMLRKKTRR